MLQPPGTITITSSKAQIPISFQNTSNQDVTVHMKLESDRLLFPDGAERDVVLPRSRSTTVRVAVETRGSGTSPVELTVTTPDGLPIGEQRRITVRSTFVSGVGVFLTVGAIVVPRHLVGLGHPPAAPEALAGAPPFVPGRRRPPGSPLEHT